MLGKPYAAENQCQGDCVIDVEILAKKHDRQERAEDGHEVDEQARTIGADHLDAADIGHLLHH